MLEVEKEQKAFEAMRAIDRHTKKDRCREIL